LNIWICPLREAIFCRIRSCKPLPVAIAIRIITTPSAIALMAILIIGEEILLLPPEL
jgi:hypothetical protein